ncbi:LLM class flavin-dependent oxidoreductase [Amycolatopsis sp. GA6-003]|uniref:LLM class flavin-dependent oxidoreductase n=1 Tax=Amycolatopsis sp. GA6-003 TaxID=2652444 RepID=UPI00391702FA
MDISVTELLDRARTVEQAGVDSAWLVQLPTLRDSASVLAALAVSTRTLRLGAAVLPYYSRPPAMMGQTAATIDELSGGRFTLAVGTGHPMIAEWSLGRSPGNTLALMREYLTAVRGLLREGEIALEGNRYRVHAVYSSPRRPDQPVYLGAFGPKMCFLAGELADGLVLWMCTPGYVADVALPKVQAGLREGGRDTADFGITVVIPGGVSADLDFDRQVLRRYLSTYARVPNYRRMYEASGLASEIASGQVGDALLDGVGVVGDENQVRAGIQRYHDAGATEVVLAPMAGAHYDRALLQRTAEALAG